LRSWLADLAALGLSPTISVEHRSRRPAVAPRHTSSRCCTARTGAGQASTASVRGRWIDGS